MRTTIASNNSEQKNTNQLDFENALLLNKLKSEVQLQQNFDNKISLIEKFHDAHSQELNLTTRLKFLHFLHTFVLTFVDKLKDDVRLERFYKIYANEKEQVIADLKQINRLYLIETPIIDAIKSQFATQLLALLKQNPQFEDLSNEQTVLELVEERQLKNVSTLKNYYLALEQKQKENTLTDREAIEFKALHKTLEKLNLNEINNFKKLSDRFQVISDIVRQDISTASTPLEAVYFYEQWALLLNEALNQQDCTTAKGFSAALDDSSITRFINPSKSFVSQRVAEIMADFNNKYFDVKKSAYYLYEDTIPFIGVYASFLTFAKEPVINTEYYFKTLESLEALQNINVKANKKNKVKNLTNDNFDAEKSLWELLQSKILSSEKTTTRFFKQFKEINDKLDLARLIIRNELQPGRIYLLISDILNTIPKDDIDSRLEFVTKLIKGTSVEMRMKLNFPYSLLKDALDENPLAEVNNFYQILKTLKLPENEELKSQLKVAMSLSDSNIFSFVKTIVSIKTNNEPFQFDKLTTSFCKGNLVCDDVKRYSAFLARIGAKNTLSAEELDKLFLENKNAIAETNGTNRLAEVPAIQQYLASIQLPDNNTFESLINYVNKVESSHSFFVLLAMNSDLGQVLVQATDVNTFINRYKLIKAYDANNRLLSIDKLELNSLTDQKLKVLKILYPFLKQIELNELKVEQTEVDLSTIFLGLNKLLFLTDSKNPTGDLSKQSIDRLQRVRKKMQKAHDQFAPKEQNFRITYELLIDQLRESAKDQNKNNAAPRTPEQKAEFNAVIEDLKYIVSISGKVNYLNEVIKHHKRPQNRDQDVKLDAVALSLLQKLLTTLLYSEKASALINEGKLVLEKRKYRREKAQDLEKQLNERLSEAIEKRRISRSSSEASTSSGSERGLSRSSSNTSTDDPNLLERPSLDYKKNSHKQLVKLIPNKSLNRIRKEYEAEKEKQNTTLDNENKSPIQPAVKTSRRQSVSNNLKQMFSKLKSSEPKKPLEASSSLRSAAVQQVKTPVKPATISKGGLLSQVMKAKQESANVPSSDAKSRSFELKRSSYSFYKESPRGSFPTETVAKSKKQPIARHRSRSHLNFEQFAKEQQVQVHLKIEKEDRKKSQLNLLALKRELETKEQKTSLEGSVKSFTDFSTFANKNNNNAKDERENWRLQRLKEIDNQVNNLQPANDSQEDRRYRFSYLKMNELSSERAWEKIKHWEMIRQELKNKLLTEMSQEEEQLFGKKIERSSVMLQKRDR